MTPRVDEFTARAVAYEVMTDGEARTLVLAEGLDGDGRTLEVQRALDPEDDDARLPCVVLDAAVVHYGAIDAWSLHGATLALALTDDASVAFGAVRLDVHLPDPALVAPVRAAMHHLVDDGPEAPEFNSTR